MPAPSMISKSVIGMFSVLLYGSGLLVWPVCALMWRGSSCRAKVLIWAFLAEAIAQELLFSFYKFSPDVLEPRYYWLTFMILLNLFFTPVMTLAAVHDYGRSKVEEVTSETLPIYSPKQVFQFADRCRGFGDSDR